MLMSAKDFHPLGICKTDCSQHRDTRTDGQMSRPFSLREAESNEQDAGMNNPVAMDIRYTENTKGGAIRT